MALATDPVIAGGGRKNGGYSADDIPLIGTALPDAICMAHGQGGAEVLQDHCPTLTCNHEAPILAYDGPTHTLRAEGFDASEDGTGRGTPLIPVMVPLAFDTTNITSASNYSNLRAGDPCHPLAAGAHAPAIAFSCKDHGGDAGDVAPTLRAMGHGTSHANAGGQVAVAMGVTIHGTDGTQTVASYSETAQCLRARIPGGVENSSRTVVHHGTAVRRLTPRECERLQGFPDDWTLIPVTVRKKITAERFAYLRETYPDLTATAALLLARDGPRYKAIGNSWAVPCARWVGERIATHLIELSEVTS